MMIDYKGFIHKLSELADGPDDDVHRELTGWDHADVYSKLVEAILQARALRMLEIMR